ncbi:serine/threonine-protein kinase [Pseudonocardia acaciae]|uniref:serine/threonine-protein kinase n=1 Tax=Pseudonocardia acaciae TaxID=551276 RepID=UPI0006850C6B|nr:serine/threonine-protein kinase [Pseudonocardia acaciae]
MTTCAEPGPGGQPCGGPIDAAGYCERCGMSYAAPTPPPAPDSTRPAPASSGSVPSGSSGGRSSAGSGRRGSSPGSGRRSSSIGRGKRARTLPDPGRTDPRAALLSDAALPERKRFCRNPRCRRPVGRASGERPGRVEGFCRDCGWRFSFRPPLEPNTEVADRYVVEGPIGRGGLGWVYLATDRKVGRYVVLKGLVNPDDAAHSQVPLDELRALGQAQHPNIVAVHDAVMHPYQLPGPGNETVPIDYIVMDYIGGRSLLQLHRERRDRGGYLPITEICEYTLQALDALDHLHTRGLLYNDFSPDNLMRSDDGRVWLIDLGGVSVADDPSGGAWGKDGYRDPFGSPPSAQTDLYAVGRTMAALSFRLPHFADAKKGLPSPDEEPLLARHESYHLFLLRATHPDPERRFYSAADMADQLEAVLREVRAVELGEPQPGLSDVFGPELRVVGADPEHVTRRPDPVAAALALPDPQIDPADPQARRLAAITGTGSPREVLQALDGLPAHTLETRLRAVRARVELVAGGERAEHDTLRAELDTLADEEPDEVRVRWFAGLAALVAGETERAASEFDEVLRAVPGEAAPKLALGLCAELLDRPERAARRYQTVWGTDRSYVSAAFGLARCRIALGERDAAVAALAQVPNASRYAAAALLCSVAQAHPGDDPGGALAPAFFACAERLRDQDGDLDLDESRRYRGYATALGAALDWLAAGRPWPAAAGTVPSRLLGFGLDERGLRDGLEWSYRQLASVAPEQRVRWVDRANAERNWSLW